MLTLEQMTAIYEQEMENAPLAGLDVINAKRKIHAALDAYCAALKTSSGRMRWAMKPEKRKKA